MKNIIFTSLLLLAGAVNCHAQNVIDVNTKKLGAQISNTMYGVFFEDINFGADGGLYGEMVKNRSFEFPQTLMGWNTMGNIEVRTDGPFERCPHYLRLGQPSHNDRRTVIENEGFFGMGIKKDSTYLFSVWARCADGGNARLHIQLTDNLKADGEPMLAEQYITVNGSQWKRYTASLKATVKAERAHLRVRFMNRDSKSSAVDVEHISLFPKDTWKGREGGLRKDVAQAVADLKPGVFRFPGGCIVEGADLATRYNWKNSVGPVENRPLNENRWNYTFNNRIYPDYFQSYGLGFYELFLLAEDMGAEPLPVVSCGLACQYQNDFEHLDKASAHAKEILVSTDDLQSYIQDAIDLIEFANGDVNTKWGKVRKDMGHPEPFNLKYLAVGNEQWDYKDDPLFTERLRLFTKALRKSHPEILLVGSVGPGPDDWKYKMLKPLMEEIGVDLYDEHYYKPEDWFLKSATRYDKYSRKGPKVFAGEYACHTKGLKQNNYKAAICEAAVMTGFERNADLVKMATYAPLFAHKDGWQWRPDLIWFDNLKTLYTCSYYVQQMFSTNKGTNVLSCMMQNDVVAGKDGQNGLYASAAKDVTKNEIIVKVVNTSDANQDIEINLKGMKKGNHQVVTTALRCENTSEDIVHGENTFEQPERYMPKTTTSTMEGETLKTSLSPQSFYVIRINN